MPDSAKKMSAQCEIVVKDGKPIASKEQKANQRISVPLNKSVFCSPSKYCV